MRCVAGTRTTSGSRSRTTAAQPFGGSVWSVFDGDTDYFGPGSQAWMVNFRVSNLDAMPEQLRGAGAEVDDRVEEHEYGRFGGAVDPEGNRFELWEPPARM
jgi:predicted enzyme related to lactoylglutathione lyase